MKTTRHFEQQVLRKRPYIKRAWCAAVLKDPVKSEQQANGRVRYWGYVKELGDRALRVITLAVGKTVHNAFPDRDFERPEQ